MASLIPGYEYDIFISYRQKDNKGDKWVTEFVEALKDELESTFKEEISVYFDINPHDGLLETHDVDESLKEKLRCLVFIPIISRTYCDTKSFAWEHEFMYEEGKKCLQKVYKRRDQIPSSFIRIRLEDMNALITEGPQGRIKYLKQLPNFDDQDPHNYSDLGFVYNILGQYNNAIPELEKAIDLYKRWNVKPFYILQYTWLGEAYHETGQYRKEKKLYKKAEKDFPDDPTLIQRQAILALSEGKTKAANEYIEKYISIRKGNSATDATLASNLAGIYSGAGILDTAEVYYRKALSLGHSAGRLNTRAYFLIDYDRDINEGLELVNRALEISPDNYNFLHTKGWGLYKQGKYKDALDILQKSWDIRIEESIYDHEAFLHLEAAKMAIASKN